MKILFRADSSSDIGTGHIMRDLVLAAQYPDAEILFAVQDLPGNINGKIVEVGYDIEILKSNRINVLNRILEKYVPDMLVIDHYGIDYWFEKEIKSRYPGLILLSFDDTYEKHYCDILLNHNIYANEARYDGLVPLHCELKCGSEYTLFREEFQKEKAKGRQNRNSLNTLKVFICMGGTDHANITPKILAVMQLFPNIHSEVVTTTANAHLSELEAYAANHPNVTLHINTTKIARLMNETHLAIVTPSVILNEIFYMGVPFVAIKTANNQKFMYEYLLKSGDIALAGFNWGQLREKISLFIKPLHIELINFIDLCLDEKKMILTWRNNDKVRQWMFIQEQIALATHLDYINFLKNCNNLS
ncbi:UDP-2,4-diacetamido-2,4,6-trideoxy-beta-L-altropyranose hydrolase, partial [Sulfurovum sp.]|uniref:UDP-2,4-diacetamido-2,4, 6-trideoxy-beta-L-altropyranose hydrolase n=1 Tax=Sulfurovum sp. TaxID=1969726 RepID=UPI0025EE04BB